MKYAVLFQPKIWASAGAYRYFCDHLDFKLCAPGVMLLMDNEFIRLLSLTFKNTFHIISYLYKFGNLLLEVFCEIWLVEIHINCLECIITFISIALMCSFGIMARSLANLIYKGVAAFPAARLNVSLFNFIWLKFYSMHFPEVVCISLAMFSVFIRLS